MRDGAERERDPRELAARGRLGRRERTAGPRSGGSRNATSSRPVGPGLALADVDAELAVPHPEPCELAGDGLGERLRRASARALESAVGQPRRRALRPRTTVRSARLERVDAGLDCVELRLRGGGAGEQLLVASAAPKRRRASAIRSSSASTSSSRPGSASSDARKPRSVEATSRSADLRVAELRRQPRPARARARPRARASARPRRRARRLRRLRLLGRERLGGVARGLRELGRRGEAARARPRSRSSSPGFEALACARRAPGAPRAARSRPAAASASSSPAAARGGELPPRARELGAAAQLLVADEGVEHVELDATGARGGAARTGPTWRAAARRALRDPRAERRGPRRRRGCVRRRRRGARRRGRPRLRAEARRRAVELRAPSRSPSGRSSSASTYASSAPGPR